MRKKTKAESDYRQKKPLASAAYDIIYRKIISMAYAPGEILEEKRVMADLELGRTPIREALARLAGDMMLISEPNKGFIVRPITIQATRAVFEALEILETGVAGLAMHRDIRAHLDEMAQSNQALEAAIQSSDMLRLVETNHDFHMHFARCSGNDYLVRSLYDVRCEANRLAYLSYSNEIDTGASLDEHYASVLEQHGQLMALLKEKDRSKLNDLIRDHLNIFKNRIIRYLTAWEVPA